MQERKSGRRAIGSKRCARVAIPCDLTRVNSLVQRSATRVKEKQSSAAVACVLRVVGVREQCVGTMAVSWRGTLGKGKPSSKSRLMPYTHVPLQPFTSVTITEHSR